MNDGDRGNWVMNDEGLYDWWRTSSLGMRAFVRLNRSKIDEIIEAVRSGKKLAHYLKYEADR